MAKIKRDPKAVAFAEEFVKNYHPEIGRASCRERV